MDRILFILCFWFFCCSLAAQNPFDIKSRKDTPPKEKPVLSEKPVSTEKPEAVKTLPTSKPLEISPAKEEVKKEELSISQPVSQKQTAKTSSNPFDVSHVPLSGSGLKKKPTKSFSAPAPIKDKTPDKKESKIFEPKPDKAKTTIPLESSSNRIVQKKKFLERNLPFLLLFISLLILAFVIGFAKKTITNVIRSTYNENFMKLINKQSSNGRSTAFLLLYTLFFINVALLIYHFVKDRTELHTGLLFVYIIGGLLFAYLIRHSFLFLLGLVFKDIKKETSQYSFTIEVFNICTGLALLPLNFFISFGSEGLSQFCLYIAMGIFAIIFIIRTIRAILLSSRYLLRNKFHYFLYLCTCEIGPVFVLIKVLTDYL